MHAEDNDEVMLISDGGTLVRTRVNEISVMGRNTQGVRLISLANDEKLVGKTFKKTGLTAEELADWIIQGDTEYRLIDIREEAAFAADPRIERVQTYLGDTDKHVLLVGAARRRPEQLAVLSA